MIEKIKSDNNIKYKKNFKHILYLFLKNQIDLNLPKFKKNILEILYNIRSSNLENINLQNFLGIFFKLKKISYNKNKNQNILINLFNYYIDILSSIIPKEKFNLEISEIKKINKSIIKNSYYKKIYLGKFSNIINIKNLKKMIYDFRYDKNFSNFDKNKNFYDNFFKDISDNDNIYKLSFLASKAFYHKNYFYFFFYLKELKFYKYLTFFSEILFFRLFFSDFAILNEFNYDLFVLVVLYKVLKTYEKDNLFKNFLEIIKNKLNNYELNKENIEPIFNQEILKENLSNKIFLLIKKENKIKKVILLKKIKKEIKKYKKNKILKNFISILFNENKNKNFLQDNLNLVEKNKIKEIEKLKKFYDSLFTKKNLKYPNLINKQFRIQIVNIKFENIFDKKEDCIISKYLVFPLFFIFHKKFLFYYISKYFHFLNPALIKIKFFKDNLNLFFKIIKNFSRFKINKFIKQKTDIILQNEILIRKIIKFEEEFSKENIINYSEVIKKLLFLDEKEKLFENKNNFYINLEKTAKRLDNINFSENIKEILNFFEDEKEKNIKKFKESLFSYLDKYYLNDKNILLNYLEIKNNKKINSSILKTFPISKYVKNALKKNICFLYTIKRSIKFIKNKKIEKQNKENKEILIMERKLKNLYEINNLFQDLKIKNFNQKILKILFTRNFKKNFLKNNFITIKDLFENFQKYYTKQIDDLIFFDCFRLFFLTIFFYFINFRIINFFVFYENFRSGLVYIFLKFFIIIFLTSFYFYWILFRRLFFDNNKKKEIVMKYIYHNLRI